MTVFSTFRVVFIDVQVVIECRSMMISVLPQHCTNSFSSSPENVGTYNIRVLGVTKFTPNQTGSLVYKITFQRLVLQEINGFILQLFRGLFGYKITLQ